MPSMIKFPIKEAKHMTCNKVNIRKAFKCLVICFFKKRQCWKNKSWQFFNGKYAECSLWLTPAGYYHCQCSTNQPSSYSRLFFLWAELRSSAVAISGRIRPWLPFCMFLIIYPTPSTVWWCRDGHNRNPFLLLLTLVRLSVLGIQWLEIILVLSDGRQQTWSTKHSCHILCL